MLLRDAKDRSIAYGLKFTALAKTPDYLFVHLLKVGGEDAIGGLNGGVYQSVVQEYDPVANSWASKAAMPSARAYLGVAAAYGRIFALGGLNNLGIVLDVVEEYDPVGNSWVTRQPMPDPRREFTTAVFNDKIYAIAGIVGPGNVNTVEEYDRGPLGYLLFKN